MPLSIQQFIKLHDRQELTTVTRHDPVGAALDTMIANDFTLLPVIDDAGMLTGVISEQSIMRTYYHAEGQISLLDLTVAHCEEAARTVGLSDRLSTALRLLEDAYAVIIVEGRKPCGILTDYDTNRFFRDFSEDLMMVEKIERRLREEVEAVFHDPSARRQVAKEAARSNGRSRRGKSRQSDWLTFNEYLRIIDHDEHWPQFERTFETRDLFFYLMDQVREIRNQLAHFNDRPSTAQRDLLRRALHWIENRPAVASAKGENA